MSENHDEIPTKHDGSPLYDLGNGVYAEWWRVIDHEHPDFPNDPGKIYGIVEHHWCISDTEIVPGVKEYWSMGSVPTLASQPVKWTIVTGGPDSFEHLTLTPSVLCQT